MSSTTWRMWGAYHLTRSMCAKEISQCLPSPLAILENSSCRVQHTGHGLLMSRIGQKMQSSCLLEASDTSGNSLQL